MLYIKLGITPDVIINVDDNFNFEYEDEWFEDPLVQEMVLDVDKTKVVLPHLMESPVFGAMPPKGLSSGVKALIMMLKTDYKIWATACGDNCAKWIVEIAKQKDLTIYLEHMMVFPDELEAVMVTSIECKIPVIAVDINADEDILSKYQNHVFVFDERCKLLHHKQIGTLLKNSNNYFIILSRKKFDWLPVSVDSVFVIKHEGRKDIFVPAIPRYNEEHFGKIVMHKPFRKFNTVYQNKFSSLLKVKS